MNRKNTEKRKIEWMEVIPIAIIVISTMVFGWWMLNKEYNDYKKYHSSMRKIRTEFQQTLKECEQFQKERDQKLNELEREYRESKNKWKTRYK